MNEAPDTPELKALAAFLAASFDSKLDGKKMREAMVWTLGTTQPVGEPSAEMVNRFLRWKLPADFHPDCGISFKPESDYDHPEFGRTKYEPLGTNLLNYDQAREMLKHVLATTTRAALATPAQAGDAGEPSDGERYRWLRDRSPWTLISANGITRLAARLPVTIEGDNDDANELDQAIDAAIRATKGGKL